MISKKFIDKPIFGLVGAGGFGRETIQFIHTQKKKYEIYFVDSFVKSKYINEIKVISDDQFFSLNTKKKYFNVSVSDGHKREKISNLYKKNGVKPLTLHSKNSTNHGFNEIGTGCTICDYTVISPNSKIGDFVHINRGAQVAHDTSI